MPNNEPIDLEDFLDYQNLDIEQANRLARLLYAAQGYEVEPGYEFHKATHPQESGMFSLACIAINFCLEEGV